MNETVGAKGGANDRRRVMTINQNQKKKLKDYEEERELAELEKRVKRKQIYTLIKTLPIAIGGGTIQVLYDTAKNKKKENKEEEGSRWIIKEYDQDVTHYTPKEFEEKKKKIVTTPTGEKVVVYIETSLVEKQEEAKPIEEKPEKEPTFIFVEPTDFEIKQPKTSPVIEKKQEENASVKEEQEEVNHEEKDISLPQDGKEEETLSKETIKPPKKQETAKPSKGISPTSILAKEPKTEAKEEQVDVEDFIDQELGDVEFENLSQDAQETLGKLKSRKIVEEYEKRLKDIRFELRQIIYEYNALVDEEERVVLSREAEIILERLSQIIDKIEELKARIKIENLDQYDDNYIYFLIEGYLKEFRDKRVVREVKDSPLYILLEEKLEELDKKRGSLSKEVSDKKEKLEEREIDFEEVKKKYDSYSQFNNQLMEFQYDQSRLLREIQNKVANAVTETEKVKEEFVGLTGQSRRLLRMLSIQMLFPGLRGAKRAATATAAYLYFMKNVMKPTTKTTRYKVITVKDYHEEIQGSINAIDDVIRILGKTTSQIEKMISEIKEKFKDYIGVIPECDELLANLHKVKREMKEKEYEMQRIKAKQEKELEKNDAKVKTRGEYPVN
ncbi:MAG: hypothetical protein IKF71_04565 [Bacilli bacterium]|nr:hypothetical protein [Bacilli bacterium]